MDGQTVAPGDEPYVDDDSSQAQYDKDKTYWAMWLGKDLAQALDDKQRAYFETARNRGLIAFWIIAYAAHHGLTPQDLRDFATQQIGFEGNELEMLRFHINVTRSYARHTSIMALGEKPAFKAMVVNSDHKSQVKAELADKIVNSLYQRYSEDRDGEVAESDGVFGMGGTHYRWDFKGGDQVKVPVPVMEPVTDPQTGMPVIGDDGKPAQQQRINPKTGAPLTHNVPAKSGAPVVTTVYPWCLVQETRQSGEPLWNLVRSTESKWNLTAEYPDKRDAILALTTASDMYDFGQLFRLEELEFANKDLITVKHFYHARCTALEEGRYVVMVGDIVLWDGPCPTKSGLPIATMRSSTFIETTFGYCDGWDGLAISQALNQVNSDELTNYANYGRQSVAYEKGTNVTYNGLVKGTAFEVPAGTGGRMPVALQMTAIPATLPNLKQYLHTQLDHIYGSNPTARGEPEANVRSGEMAALLDSIALRYQSYRQQAARKFRIRGATIILDMIERYGETPFLVDITGVEDRSYVAEFTKDDLSGVERITMDVVSPLMQSISGRWQMYSLLKDLPPEQRAAAYELIATGDTSLFVRKDRTSEMQVRRENEDLVTGEREVFCTSGEDAVLHYMRHWAQREQVLASDDQDPDVLKRIDEHLAKTVQNWFGMSGAVAALRGITPPPALGPTQDNPQGNPLWQLQAQVSAGQNMLASAGMPAAPPAGPGPQNGAAAGAGNAGSAKAAKSAAQQSTPSSARAQLNDQGGGPQVHPSGTSLPQPSTPPGQ